ncbi:MAG: tetratricopeptide repeat protein [Chthoniobacterales bacterium]
MSEGNFFAELKRRNVYKVAVAYAVVGWLIAQIATQIFPFLEIPNWIVRLVIVLIAIGFPIALVIAWAFETTPEGIKRTEVADAKHEHSRGKVWIYVVIIGAAISVALFFLGRYTLGNKNVAASANELTKKSIAVLPFDNLSEDKGNAYFAEGVQDEILTRLAKVADLKVISRTSTQRFKSAPDNLPQIAKQLGVMNILDGTVQKSNGQVRVNVQLINAITDAHLWAEIYDRKLTDIFAVESDIAKTIADTLQAKLTGSELSAISSRPTRDPVAQDLYVQGRHFLALRRDDNLPRAIEFFHQAIARDANFAAAYAGLSEALILLPRYTSAYPSETRPQSRVAALKALELNPNLAEAHNALAKIAMDYDVDFAEATREFRRAIELNPNYAGAHHWFSGTLESQGQFAEAIAESKLGTELDPFSAVNLVDQGRIYGSARRFPEAKAVFEKALAIDPAFSYAHWHYGEMLQVSGDLKGAAEEYAKASTANNTPEPIALSGQLAAIMGRPEEARQALTALDELETHRYVDFFWRALLYLGLGDKDRALQFLEQSYANNEGYEIGLIRVDPMLDSLRAEPRFQALVKKVRGQREEPKH